MAGNVDSVELRRLGEAQSKLCRTDQRQGITSEQLWGGRIEPLRAARGRGRDKNTKRSWRRIRGSRLGWREEEKKRGGGGG